MQPKKCYINPLKLVKNEHLSRQKVGFAAASKSHGCSPEGGWPHPLENQNRVYTFVAHTLSRDATKMCLLPISSPCPILASTERSSGESMRGMFLRMTIMVRVKRRS